MLYRYLKAVYNYLIVDLILLKLIQTTSQPTKPFAEASTSHQYHQQSAYPLSYTSAALPAPNTVRKSRKKKSFCQRMVSGVVAAGSRRQQPDDPVRLKMIKAREEHAKKQKFDYSHVFR
jgi:hypothetical protein